MPKRKLIFVMIAGFATLHAQAQWTSGTAVYVTDTTKNVLIGTTSNSANLYVRKSNAAVTMGISSGSAGATMFMDKATTASNAAFAYRLLGTNVWNSGMIGNNNFTIRDVSAAKNPFVIQQTTGFVGLGTGVPVTRLDVQGNGWFRSNSGTGFPTSAGQGLRLYYDDALLNGQIYAYDYLNNVSKNLCIQVPGGNVGVGTSSPTAKLDVNGATRIQSLALGGAPNRPVFADANGVLVTNTQTTLGTFAFTTPTSMTGLAWPCDTLKTNIVVSGMPTSVKSGGISVTLNISKNRITSFRAFLRAPNGQRIGLVNGANLVNKFIMTTVLTNTVIIDNGDPISSATEPYTGTYAPAGNISPSCFSSAPLVGTFSQFGSGFINPNGTWTLEMESNWTGSVDVGQVSSWSIAFTEGEKAGGTNNYFPKWNNGALTETSSIYSDGNNVAIGTTNAHDHKLDVVGSFGGHLVGIQNKSDQGSSSIAFRDSSGAEQAFLGCANFGYSNPQLAGHAYILSNDFIFASQNTEVMRYTINGLGIAQPNPGGLLELGLDQGRKPSTSTWTIVSDERLKNIDGAYTKGLKEIIRLDPITYHYKNVGDRKFNEQVLKTQSVGFTAQDVQKVFPEAVDIDKDGYLNLNIHSIIIAQVNAIKELSEQNETKNSKIAELQNQLNDMQQCVQSLCANNESKTKNSELQTSNYLFQNQPNPFNQTTVISYQLLSDAKNASIVIRGLNGEELKSITLSNTGKGQVTINANELAQGTYTYTLIVNGKSVDTKLMVVTK